MPDKRSFFQIVTEICRRDGRYKPEAYEFVMQGLSFSQQKLKRKGHLSGRELTEGLRNFAIEQYGPLAKNVLNHWGVYKTEDFGDIVFNLIDERILSKTETDTYEDFKNVYAFDSAFSDVLREAILKDNPKGFPDA